MSDDEMRGLFSGKFADFEVSTKRGIWSKIDAGLSAARRKSVARGTVYSTVALLMVASVTMYFMTESKVVGERMETRPHVQEMKVASVGEQVVTRQVPASLSTQASAAQVSATHHIIPASTPDVARKPEIKYYDLHIAELYSVDIPELVFNGTTKEPGTIQPQKAKRKIKYVANVETFINFKHTWVNRYDDVFQNQFNSGEATGFRRFGYAASAGVRLPFLKGSIEAGGSLRQYRYSVSFTQLSVANELPVVKEIDFSNLGVGLWSDYYPGDGPRSFFAGASVQTLISTPAELRSKSAVAMRAGYLLPIFSNENLVFVAKPVVTYNLTSLNFGTFRSRPYFFGVEVGIRTNN
jgi:hypothetical protein